MNRQDSVAVISRELPRNLTVRTVFGDIEVNTKKCNTCHVTRPVSAFYLKSKSTRRHPDDTREQCIPCWDLNKGRK